MTTDAARDDGGPLVDCANCGGPIETDEWHPVTSERGPDGEFRIVPFCGRACRREWLPRASDAPTEERRDD